MNKSDYHEELVSIRRVLNAFAGYGRAVEQEISRWESSYNCLSEKQKVILPHLPKKFSSARSCLESNTEFITAMLEAFEPPMVASDPHSEQECSHPKPKCPDPQPLPEDSRESAATDPEPSLKHAKTSGQSLQSASHAPPAESRARSPDSCENNGGCCNDGPGQLRKYRGWFQPTPGYVVPPQDADKVQCMIRSFVRDWSSEGASERAQSYAPILSELQRTFSARLRPPARPPSCLVPGAGLCRLALEIACLGFLCQANEFSFYTLVCSSFVLNHVSRAEEWRIHPWVTASCNSLQDQDQTRPVLVPDMAPCEAPVAEGFSMCAGDFVEVYSHPSQQGAWDSVVTCFFLDTAANVVKYIEVIAGLLRPGGVWINFGPLLYHFAGPAAGQAEQHSLELSLEDVKKVASHFGLRLQREETRQATYTANVRSMMRTQYSCAFWTMVRL